MLKTKIRSILHNKALLAVFLVVALSIGAVTVAWALSIGTYDQCANDAGDGYATGDTGCRWINGNLQSNNSTYYEGDSTVQRLWLIDLAPGSTHSVTLKYGTTKAGKHAYDFLTTWDWSENWVTLPDRCQDITGCETVGETTLPIPLDPLALGFDAAVGSRQFVMRGGTLTGATVPTVVSGDYTGDSETVITVSFTVASSGDMCTTKSGVTTCGVALWFGAHIATQTDWGIDMGAGAIPGSPYHVALDQVDGAAVGQRDNQMQANAVVPNGNIVIVKDAVPNSTQDFAFALLGSDNVTVLQSFSLDDDAGVLGANDDLLNSKTISVPPGTYTAAELGVPPDWFLTDLVCVDPTNNTTVNLAAGTAAIDLASAETVTCTYTNTQYATIIVRKVTVPPNAAYLFDFDLRDGISNALIGPSDMTPSTNPFTRSAQQVAGLAIQVKPGQFKLTELNAYQPNDWQLIDVVCTGNNVSGSNWTWTAATDYVAGNLGAAMLVDCTFVNKAGELAVKLVDFTANWVPKTGVVLDWKTANDNDTLGFNVYRASSQTGPWKQINSGLIENPQPGANAEHDYTFTDSKVVQGRTYWYRLDEVALNGTVTSLDQVVSITLPKRH